MVNHPEHYNKHPSGIECIEIVRHHNFNIGNTIKYLWRAGLKVVSNISNNFEIKKIESEIEDLQKAAWYINDEINRLKEKKKKIEYELRNNGLLQTQSLSANVRMVNSITNKKEPEL